MLPLFRAVIIVLDELLPTAILPRDSDGALVLDAFSQIRSVLIVRTGEESGLSAPISFEGLKLIPAHSSLITRPGIIKDKTDAVRVSLAVAVKFIASLQRREEEAL
jgi:hypothetical protein